MESPKLQPGCELTRPSKALLQGGPLTEGQIDDFFRTGVVVVPGLLQGDLLERAIEAKERIEQNAAPVGEYEGIAFRVWEKEPVFRELAVDSPFSRAAAQLTPRPTVDDGVKPARQLVVLRDAYFKLRGSGVGCNFHVDDPFFWPCLQGEPGPGVNIWVALDPVTEDGGGLAVAPGSHTIEFLDCREAIRANTCMIHKLNPAASAKLEAIAQVPLMNPGDAIVHTRYLFHRAEPFKVGSAGAAGRGIARYSVRYMPSNALSANMRFENGQVITENIVALRDADEAVFPTALWSSREQ